MPEHSTPTTSDRGFDSLPDIPGEYGGHVSVYESSAASGPHVWLRACAPNRSGEPPSWAALHLRADNAWRLAEQLMWLARNHYQGDASPTVDPEVRERLARHLHDEHAEGRRQFDDLAGRSREHWLDRADKALAVITGKEG